MIWSGMIWKLKPSWGIVEKETVNLREIVFFLFKTDLKIGNIFKENKYSAVNTNLYKVVEYCKIKAQIFSLKFQDLFYFRWSQNGA